MTSLRSPSEPSSTHQGGRSNRMWQIALRGVALLIAVILFDLWVIWPWTSSWGATDWEMDRALPGDDLVLVATVQTTKAIAIDARPDQIYPWLLQLGVDRGGMYSYDWLDNLLGLHVDSANEIIPDWQTTQAGDFVRFTPVDYPLNPGPGLYIRGLKTDQWLTACFGMEHKPDEPCIDTWQFVLEPQADGSTRLLLRSRMDVEQPLLVRLTYPVQFVMERKMLLGIRDRAEDLAAGW